MNVQEKWEELCEAWVNEDWKRLEELGGEVQNLIRAGQIPTVGKREDLGRGLNEAMARAGVEFVMQRFKRDQAEP